MAPIIVIRGKLSTDGIPDNRQDWGHYCEVKKETSLGPQHQPTGLLSLPVHSCFLGFPWQRCSRQHTEPVPGKFPLGAVASRHRRWSWHPEPATAKPTVCKTFQSSTHRGLSEGEAEKRSKDSLRLFNLSSNTEFLLHHLRQAVTCGLNGWQVHLRLSQNQRTQNLPANAGPVGTQCRLVSLTYGEKTPFTKLVAGDWSPGNDLLLKGVGSLCGHVARHPIMHRTDLHNGKSPSA